MLIRRVLSPILVGGFGLYVVVVVAAYFGQRALLFPAPAEAVRPSALSKVVELPSTVLMVRDAPTPTSPVVLHFHGNGQQLASVEWMADHWQRVGAGFVAVEYPGYCLAKAKGETGEESILQAAEAAAEYVRTEFGVSRERLIISGQSLGTGPAVQLAARGLGSKLVLLSPYTSLPDVAARTMPFLPVRVLMKDRFDSSELAPQIQQPVLIIHGTQDEVIPYDLGEALLRRLPVAQLVSIEGGHHNDIARRDEVWAALTKFAWQK